MDPALTDELVAADFEAMAVDRPCSVTYTYNGVTTTVDGTKGVVDAKPTLGEIGILSAYRFSVWVRSDRFPVAPKENRPVTVDGVEHQILTIGGSDGVVVRLDLGDPNA